jgi:nucleotide-binding universal stress UspA family protein
MYANVIVGVNGREGGLDAAALAASLADPGAQRTLVYVSATRPPSDQPTLLDAELADRPALVHVFEREAELCSADRVMRVAAESAAAGLHATAERYDADLIVLGRSRRQGLRRMMSGDDAQSVLHRTPYTVAVAPPGWRPGPTALRRIGVAYDGSPHARVAVAHAGLLARQYDCELTLLRVLDPALEDPTRTVPVSGWRTASATAAPPRPPQQVDGLEVTCICGLVRSELVAFSETVDLLVCGSRRLHWPQRLVLGSVTDHLVRRAKCPVIITPPTDPRRTARSAARNALTHT